MSHRFELEGVTYYQQHRKCGKPTCKCNDGALHGPYWFARDWHGEVNYIGKNLPPEVATARVNHDYLVAEMIKKRREFLTQADILARLIKNAPLSEEDKERIKEMGFGDALVSDVASAATQEGEQLGLV